MSLYPPFAMYIFTGLTLLLGGACAYAVAIVIPNFSPSFWEKLSEKNCNSYFGHSEFFPIFLKIFCANSEWHIYIL